MIENWSLSGEPRSQICFYDAVAMCAPVTSSSATLRLHHPRRTEVSASIHYVTTIVRCCEDTILGAFERVITGTERLNVRCQ